MNHLISFTKVSGAGNDFVLIDNLRDQVHLPWDAVARALCSRAFGVGADGLLVLSPGRNCDFSLEYLNADGSSGGMCGNGGRCAARYAFEHGYAAHNVTFEALSHLYEASVAGERVILHMADVGDVSRTIRLSVHGIGTCEASFLNTGSPHLVLQVSHLEDYNVNGIGSEMRHHPLVQPEGANVNFMEFVNDRHIALRTYERGVEAETMACGTGAVAAAIAGWKQGGVTPPVSVRTRGGEILTVNFRESGHGVRSVTLEGSAHLVFSGSTLFDDETGRISLPVREASVRSR